MSKHFKKKIKNKINKKYLKVGDIVYYRNMPEIITAIDFNYYNHPPGITTNKTSILCSHYIYHIEDRQLTKEDFRNE